MAESSRRMLESPLLNALSANEACPQKNTIGQITNFHARRTGTKAILVCGDRKVPDNTLLRELASRGRGDLLVFWTIVDTKHVLSHEVRPFVWDMAKRMEEYWETNILPDDMDEDWSMSVSGHRIPTCGKRADVCRMRSQNHQL